MKYLFLLLFPVLAICSEAVYIKPKAYLDVENGRMIEGKVIGITNDKITSISSAVPKGKKILSYDLYLMPGLIDCHTHVFFAQYVADKDFEKSLVRELRLSDGFRIDRAKTFLKSYLDSGFTSVCDLGNSGQFLDLKLRNQISKDSNYPDLFVSGPGIATNKGQFYPSAKLEEVKKEYTIIDDKSDIEFILETYSHKKVDILKIYVDNSPGIGLMESALINKILNSKQIKNFKKVTFHALEPSAFKVLSGLHKGLSFEHGNSLGWGELKNKKDIYLTLTDLPKSILEEFQYYNQIFYTAQILRAKEAYSNNIKLVFGSDFYFHKDDKEFSRGKYVLKSIDAWKEATIPSLDILRAMTINAAKSLKLEKTLGIIKVGAKANLVGLVKNPLEDIQDLENIKLIINKGMIINKLQNKK